MKPGEHHEPAHVHDALAGERLGGYAHDPVALDRDVAHGVEPEFRVDDAAAIEDEVECVVGARRASNRDEGGERDQQRACCEPR